MVSTNSDISHEESAIEVLHEVYYGAIGRVKFLQIAGVEGR